MRLHAGEPGKAGYLLIKGFRLGGVHSAGQAAFFKEPEGFLAAGQRGRVLDPAQGEGIAVLPAGAKGEHVFKRGKDFHRDHVIRITGECIGQIRGDEVDGGFVSVEQHVGLRGQRILVAEGECLHAAVRQGDGNGFLRRLQTVFAERFRFVDAAAGGDIRQVFKQRGDLIPVDGEVKILCVHPFPVRAAQGQGFPAAFHSQGGDIFRRDRSDGNRRFLLPGVFAGVFIRRGCGDLPGDDRHHAQGRQHAKQGNQLFFAFH